MKMKLETAEQVVQWMANLRVSQQKVRSLLATRVTISLSNRTLFHADSYLMMNNQYISSEAIQSALC